MPYLSIIRSAQNICILRYANEAYHMNAIYKSDSHPKNRATQTQMFPLFYFSFKYILKKIQQAKQKY